MCPFIYSLSCVDKCIADVCVIPFKLTALSLCWTSGPTLNLKDHVLLTKAWSRIQLSQLSTKPLRWGQGQVLWTAISEWSLPQYQKKSTCETFQMKLSLAYRFIFMLINLFSYERFCMRAWLKQRKKITEMELFFVYHVWLHVQDILACKQTCLWVTRVSGEEQSDPADRSLVKRLCHLCPNKRLYSYVSLLAG